MYEPDRIVEALGRQFDSHPVHSFRRFLRKLPSVRSWVLSSDYNLRHEAFPQDAIAFCLMPNLHGTIVLSNELKEIFPKDFADSKLIDAKTQGWFRRQAAGFHWCFVFIGSRYPWNIKSYNSAREHR